MKNKLGDLVSGAGKTAKTLVNSTVRAIDQNGDGKFDLSDVSAIAGSAGESIRRGTNELNEKLQRPIRQDSLNAPEFQMPKFIRIEERDKKHRDGVVWQNTIGYHSNKKRQDIVNIFRDSVDAFGLSFYPDSGGEFYYVDPSDSRSYIELNEYFSFLKIARVNELKRIAQDLGAKHFKITYKEEQTTFSERKGKGKIHVKGAVAAEVGHESAQKKYSTVEVAAEMTFPGHAPVRPKVKYLQNDPSIQTLIAMRMDESAPLQRERYMLKMSGSSGMKENDAMKVDKVLSGFKCSGNATVTSEAKNEARRYLEYDIEF